MMRKNKFRTILNEILNESADEMPVIVEDKKELWVLSLSNQVNQKVRIQHLYLLEKKKVHLVC